jgi:hypothetical protein
MGAVPELFAPEASAPAPTLAPATPAIGSTGSIRKETRAQQQKRSSSGGHRREEGATVDVTVSVSHIPDVSGAAVGLELEGEVTASGAATSAAIRAVATAGPLRVSCQPPPPDTLGSKMLIVRKRFGVGKVTPANVSDQLVSCEAAAVPWDHLQALTRHVYLPLLSANLANLQDDGGHAAAPAALVGASTIGHAGLGPMPSSPNPATVFKAVEQGGAIPPAHPSSAGHHKGPAEHGRPPTHGGGMLGTEFPSVLLPPQALARLLHAEGKKAMEAFYRLLAAIQLTDGYIHDTLVLPLPPNDALLPLDQVIGSYGSYEGPAATMPHTMSRGTLGKTGAGTLARQTSMATISRRDGHIVKDHVHLLESTVLQWTKIIRSILKLDVTDVIRQYNRPSPLDEVAATRTHARHLQALSHQLSERPEILAIRNQLTLVESTYATALDTLEVELMEKADSAERNLRWAGRGGKRALKIEGRPADREIDLQAERLVGMHSRSYRLSFIFFTQPQAPDHR